MPRESSRQRTRSPSNDRRRREKRSRYPREETATSTDSTQPLSIDSLAKLDKINGRKYRRTRAEEEYSPRKERRRREVVTDDEEFIERRERRQSRDRGDRERRERRDRDRDRDREEARRKEREESRRRERREAERDESRRRDRREAEREQSRRRDRQREYEREESQRRERKREYEREEGRRREQERLLELEIEKKEAERLLVLEAEKREAERRRRREERRKRRQVSGVLLEDGDSREFQGLRGGEDDYDEKEYYREEISVTKKPWSKKKKILIAAGVVILLLLIIIPVAVVESKKKSTSASSGSSGSSSSSSSSTQIDSSALDGMSESDLPVAAQGTYLDPWTWYDLTDFNVTYTNETYGGLPIMGLNSTWDDSKAANKYVVALDKDWGSYSTTPARGVNLGGWLSIEPFITPSLFDYDESLGIIDEYTLCSYLGSEAASTLEKHYATFVTEQTFADIADAGMDHVRIPYSYWAVTTYDGDPYVFRTSWRYLLRGIEWARKYGLRINLDLHGLPGSQNGWNHSGRQGPIGWFNGTDGTLNAQRSLDIHNQLSAFFAQDRYKNIISFYGLANEPRMTFLNTTDVLDWIVDAYNIVRGNNLNATVVFGDGFRGLENWQGDLSGYGDNLLLDVHQYVIFNVGQIVYNHTEKVNYACEGWTEQAEQSQDTSTGFGPTIFAEWSQADTDCATWLNDVNVGNRWTGTYNTGDSSTQVLSATCPVSDSTTETCECDDANADSSSYSDAYKDFLLAFAEAQMYSFEQGWGWFYWTWKTESAIQWSYEKGLAAGILPAKAYERSWNCTQAIPSFDGLPENY